MRFKNILTLLLSVLFFSLPCAAQNTAGETEKASPVAVWLAFMEKNPGVRDFAHIVISGHEPYQGWAMAELEKKLKTPISLSNMDDFARDEYVTDPILTNAYLLGLISETDLKK